MIRFSLIMTICSLVGSCSAPPEPAALKNGGTSVSDAKKVVTKKSSLPPNYGGAQVGDETLRSEIKKCLDQGKFFERRDNPKAGCTEFKLAQVPCADNTITSIMDDQDKASYEGYKKDGGSLSGFLLDQCLDCSSPVGNVLCEGSGAEKVKLPGVRLFHVKQNGTVIDIKTVYIYN